MKIRTIKPSFWHDEALGELEANARFTFVGLICLADDEGRLRARPEWVKSQLFAYDETVTASDVRRYLDALHEAGVIRLYGAGRQAFAEVVNFLKHQRISRPRASELPPPSKKLPIQSPKVVLSDSPEILSDSPEIKHADLQGKQYTCNATAAHEHGTSTARALSLHDTCDFEDRTVMQEGKGREGKGREEERPHQSIASPAPAPARTHEAAPADDDDDRPGRAAILEPTVNAAEWISTVGGKLAAVMKGDTTGVAEQLFLAARRPHPSTRRRYELAKWEAAADGFIERVRSGRAPDGNPVGYIIGMVPGAGVEVEIDPAALGIDAASGGEVSEEAKAAKWAEIIAAARSDREEAAS